METKKALLNNKKIILLVVFLLIVVLFSLFINNSFKRSKYTNNPERCNVSEGYIWNETYEHCLKESEITYCKPGQRDSDVCIQVYNPVCGFTQEGEKETFSNSCVACLNSKVDFYIQGECENGAKE